jgi:hypothetical protein
VSCGLGGREDAVEKKFDVTLKALLEDAPQDWLHLVGVRDPKAHVIDADIATISGAADKVLRLHGPPPSIQHFEFQASPDTSLPVRANVYNAALEERHDLPVATTLVLSSLGVMASCLSSEPSLQRYNRHILINSGVKVFLVFTENFSRL